MISSQRSIENGLWEGNGGLSVLNVGRVTVRNPVVSEIAQRIVQK